MDCFACAKSQLRGNISASALAQLLRSNAPFADGLQFDTRGVNEALDALRERCGW
ncbi:type VI secretion protein VasI [Vibrio cholerae]|nr:type VI secretion protein VasI [Vibrio cholerae]